MRSTIARKTRVRSSGRGGPQGKQQGSAGQGGGPGPCSGTCASPRPAHHRLICCCCFHLHSTQPETVYFNESHDAARKAVDDVLDDYQALLGRLRWAGRLAGRLLWVSD